MAKQVLLHCYSVNDMRDKLFGDISNMPNGIGYTILEDSDDILATLLGDSCPVVVSVSMFDFL